MEAEARQIDTAIVSASFTSVRASRAPFEAAVPYPVGTPIPSTAKVPLTRSRTHVAEIASTPASNPPQNVSGPPGDRSGIGRRK